MVDPHEASTVVPNYDHPPSADSMADLSATLPKAPDDDAARVAASHYNYPLPLDSAADPPALQVFSVVELLETILLQLPEADLLLAQRVNKTFRDTITNCVHIQRKLFFDVTDGKAEDRIRTPALNPLLEKMFPSDGCQEMELYNGSLLPQVHPLLKCQHGCVRDQVCVHLPIIYFPKNLGKVQAANAVDKSYEHASWRRMWASRPARFIHPVASFDIAEGEFFVHAQELKAAKMGTVMKVLRNWVTAEQVRYHLHALQNHDGIYDEDEKFWTIATRRGFKEHMKTVKEGEN